MTDVESAPEQVAVTGMTGSSRRMILRNGLLVGAGVVAAGAMSVAHAGSAKAADDLQGNWAWCSKCQGLYYPNSASSICPNGYGRHGQAKSYEYFVYHNVSGNDYWQVNWAWCDLCAGLFYGDGKTTSGSCPGLAGYGPHQNSGYNYALGHNGAAAPIGYGSQYGWLWCSQCQGVFTAVRKTAPASAPLTAPHTSIMVSRATTT
jgi:hypothetical protein